MKYTAWTLLTLVSASLAQANALKPVAHDEIVNIIRKGADHRATQCYIGKALTPTGATYDGPHRECSLAITQRSDGNAIVSAKIGLTISRVELTPPNSFNVQKTPDGLFYQRKFYAQESLPLIDGRREIQIGEEAFWVKKEAGLHDDDLRCSEASMADAFSDVVCFDAGTGWNWLPYRKDVRLGLHDESLEYFKILGHDKQILKTVEKQWETRGGIPWSCGQLQIAPVEKCDTQAYVKPEDQITWLPQPVLDEMSKAQRDGQKDMLKRLRRLQRKDSK